MTQTKKTIWKRWWTYPLLILLILILGEIALFTAVAVNASRMDDPQPSDVLIVLGARIYDDGSPSPALQRRLDRAIEVYEAGYAPAIITTGAQGDDEPMPEAIAMKAYLVENGVPEEAVFTDPNSYNTQENLENAQGIMNAQGMQTAVVVTSDYHLWRALSMCKDIGLSATGAGSKNALTLPVAIRNCLQETVSWVKYVLTR